MTFLEYVCERLMGPPDGADGNTPTWPCPKCDHPRWHVRPHQPHYRDRFSCWSCQWWGDEHDLLKHFRPRLDFGERCQLLEGWRKDFAAGRSGRPTAAPTFLPGRGSLPEADDPLSVEDAYRGLTVDEKVALANAVAVKRAKAPGVMLEALAYYCYHTVKDAVRRQRAVEQMKRKAAGARKPGANGTGPGHPVHRPKE